MSILLKYFNWFSQFQKSHVLSFSSDTVDQKVLVKNLKVIVQALIQYMYKNEDIPTNLLSGDLVNNTFIC